MKNLKNLFDAFDANKSAQFISIGHYETGDGRIYENLVINTNISQENLNKANLAKLLSFDLSTFDFKGEPVDLETLKTAYNEVVESAKKSLLPYEEKGARAQAQIDAYLPVNNAIKIHKETLSVKILGMKIAGTVIAEGKPYDLGAKLKTRYKNLIKQQANFKTKKTYTLEIVDTVTMQGDTLQIN